MRNKPTIHLDNIFKVTEWEYDTEDPFDRHVIGNMMIMHTSGWKIYIDLNQQKEFYEGIVGKYLVMNLIRGFNIGGMYSPPDEIIDSSEEEGIYPNKIVGTLYFDSSDRRFHIRALDLDFICDFTYYPDLGKKITREYDSPKRISFSQSVFDIYVDKINHFSASIQDLVSTLLREQNIEPTDKMVNDIVKTFHFENEGPLERSIKDI